MTNQITEIPQILPSAVLYCNEGTADKIYKAYITGDRQSGFQVKYSNGRRGGTMANGVKNASPVDYAAAEKIFTSLIKSKIKGKYREVTMDENFAVFAEPISEDEAEKDSGIGVQLLNAITNEDADELILDDNIGMQEKKDGERRVLHVSGGIPRGVNRRGEFVALLKTTADEAAELANKVGDFVLDGELVGEILHIFDALVISGVDFKNQPFARRFAALENLNIIGRNIKIVPLVTESKAKRAFFEKMNSEGKEGVVFKRLNSSYSAGRPNSGGDHLKYKFTVDATCVVSGHNKNRRSVRIAVRGDGNLIEVGNCTIPPNKCIPEIGSFVDVNYLYAYSGGSLYQPVYKSERPDKSEADLYDSLKFKQQTSFA